MRIFDRSTIAHWHIYGALLHPGDVHRHGGQALTSVRSGEGRSVCLSSAMSTGVDASISYLCLSSRCSSRSLRAVNRFVSRTEEEKCSAKLQDSIGSAARAKPPTSLCVLFLAAADDVSSHFPAPDVNSPSTPQHTPKAEINWTKP